jgi:hypothetical protein
MAIQIETVDDTDYVAAEGEDVVKENEGVKEEVEKEEGEATESDRGGEKKEKEEAEIDDVD